MLVLRWVNCASIEMPGIEVYLLLARVCIAIVDITALVVVNLV